MLNALGLCDSDRIHRKERKLVEALVSDVLEDTQQNFLIIQRKRPGESQSNLSRMGAKNKGDGKGRNGKQWSSKGSSFGAHPQGL